MASNIIEITLKSVDKFSSNMGKAADSLKKVGSTMNKMGRITAVATTAVVGFVTVIADGIDKQAKFASRIGVSVTELSKLQFAGTQSGISIEQLNMATQRMTRRVAEAAQGMGEAKGALRELGINAREFKNLGLEDQMVKLAGAMEKVKDPADKLRLGFKLFDSEGTAMLQVLKKGSKAMQDMARDAEFLGLAISEQAAANAEHLKDSMGRATGAIKGVSRAVADELMPYLSGLANVFANSLASSRDSIASFVRSAIKGFFTTIEVIKQFGAGVHRIFTDVEAFKAFINNMAKIPGQVISIALAIGRFLIMGIWEGIKIASNLFVEFGKWIGETLARVVSGDEVVSFGDKMAEAIFNGMTKARENMSEEFVKMKAQVGIGMTEVGKSISDSLGINIELASENAEKMMSKLAEFGEVVRDEIETTAGSLRSFTEEFAMAYGEWLDNLRNNSAEFAKSFFDTMNGAIEGISNGMAEVLVEGGNMADMFKNLAKQVLKQLLAMLIKMGIQRLVLAATNTTAARGEAANEGAKAVGLAYANGVASMAAAPFPLNLGAPAFGASMSAAANTGLAAGAAIGAATGSSIVGVAHGGMTNVPREGTFLLDRGERVLSPRQNADLTNFISGNGSNGGMNIERIEININTTASNFSDIDENELEDFIAGPVYKAIDRLGDAGVRPKSFEKGGV